MPDEVLWVQKPENWITIGTLLISISALVLSFLAHRRARRAARDELFLKLRERFSSVYKDLPPKFIIRKGTEYEESDEHAIYRYWHHSFDEWYSTNKLYQKHMADLWCNYFGHAVLTGLKHTDIRKIFDKMTIDRLELGDYWTEFRIVVEKMWKDSHVGPGKDCVGLSCDGDHRVGGGRA